jgi:hypothetical protein
MEPAIAFVLGSHDHIPIGTTDDEFEKIYHDKLKPFISTLYKHPRIPAALHYSGILLHRLERAHPEFFMLIGDMVTRKQIELLGGGFYEPMMPLIPQQDKIGQIELLTTYLRKQFGKRIQGCRLPALAWEQTLVNPLNACGMQYTFLDESQFLLAGLPDPAPCITEDQGKIITVFPVSGALNAAFAQKKAAEALEGFLASVSGATRQFLCIFPDRLFVEDEGQAPETTYHFFFQGLSAFENTFDFTTPGRLFKNLKGLKKAYFPGSLSAGALLGNAVGPVPAAVPPRQFLIEYPAANKLYAKMMFTSVLTNQLRGDKSRKKTAREELWKAQCYDSFCPANGDGVYRPATRKAAYRALLEAERISRGRKPFTPSLMVFDFDLDGTEEYLFQEEQLNCYVKIQGAAVFELDYLPKTWNYLDIFSAPAEEGFRYTAFSDMLAPFIPGNDAEGEKIRFCGRENFEASEIDKARGKARFRLPIRANVPFGSIEMEKTYHLRKNTLTVHYTLINRGGAASTFSFIPSIALSFPAETAACLQVFKLNAGIKETLDAGVHAVQVDAVQFQDIKNETFITIASDLPFDVSIVHCYLERSGVSRYQSTTIKPLKPVSLEPEERFETEFSIELYH